MTTITPTNPANIQEFGIDGQIFLTALAKHNLKLIDGSSLYYYTIPNSRNMSYEAIQKIIDSVKFCRWHPSAVGKFGNGDIKIRFCCGYHACL